jgi:hypothetical protein
VLAHRVFRSTSHNRRAGLIRTNTHTVEWSTTSPDSSRVGWVMRG